MNFPVYRFCRPRSVTLRGSGSAPRSEERSHGAPELAGAPNLGNTFDSTGRLQKLTDLTASGDIISNATYAPTGQLLTMTGASGAPNETRTYNSIGQMTRLQSGSLDIQYAYPATQNNGKISSQYDSVSGEQITYMYDSLNRLASATGSGWGQSYNYDGFGNLTDQNVTFGTAPALHVTYDPATNRQTGECADANGNLCGSYYSYDVENRFVRKGASWSVTPDVAYSYRPGNKRIWKGTNYVVNENNWSLPSNEEVTFWSVNGQKLATYSLSQYQPGGYYTLPQLVAMQTGTNYYFGGKLVKNSTGYVTPDRLGSIGKYFPYGQERPSATTDGKEKFATYFRDSETGLDYAQNRYHQPGMGRFMTPDPYKASGGPSDPGSWNRYAYTRGDPVNRADPGGLDDEDCPYLVCTTVTASGFDDPGQTQFGGDDIPSTWWEANCTEFGQNCSLVGGFAPFYAPPPPCPSVPTFPTGLDFNLLQNNASQANQMFDELFKANPDSAFAGLLGWLISRFAPGGQWDYKSQYDAQTQPDAQSEARVVGNYNFGFVMQSLGFSYTFSQNAAGVAQITICAFGGSCGAGIPGLQYPYGDQKGDAIDVKKGFDYAAAKAAGCQ